MASGSEPAIPIPVDEWSDNEATSEISKITIAQEVKDTLNTAAEKGDTNTLKYVLDHNPDGVNITTGVDGRTPLHCASEHGKVEAIKLLLERGANIHHVDIDGSTPLHYASKHGKVEAIKLLLERGANIHHEDIAGSTPLHYASEYGRVDAIKLLLERGANIHHVNKAGRTPLHHASWEGKVEAIKLLLERGANIHQVDNTSKIKTMMTEANIRKYFLNLVEYLPMNDVKFRARLYSAGLLPGNLRDEVQSKPTPAEKTEHILHYGIKNDTDSFNKLLTIMENHDDDLLKKLAEMICGEAGL